MIEYVIQLNLLVTRFWRCQ